ncbi:hypothetical protein ACM9HF_18455 [Colwellia sp. RE-S-Sl-9]
MKNIKIGFIAIVSLLTSMFVSSHLYAHVMVAQHGTLNVIDNKVFMVLSLPVSAFEGVDDDNDGKLSKTEFTRHRTVISNLIHKRVVLKENNDKLVLQDMLLSPVVSHQSSKSPVSQLIVMGRYSLADPFSQLEYEVDLFGTEPTEQLLEVTATRKSDQKKQLIKLTVKGSSISIF